MVPLALDATSSLLAWLGDEADATNIYDDDDESSPSALLPPKHFLTPFLALPGGHGTESVPKRDFYVCVYLRRTTSPL